MSGTGPIPGTWEASPRLQNLIWDTVDREGIPELQATERLYNDPNILRRFGVRSPRLYLASDPYAAFTLADSAEGLQQRSVLRVAQDYLDSLRQQGARFFRDPSAEGSYYLKRSIPPEALEVALNDAGNGAAIAESDAAKLAAGVGRWQNLIRALGSGLATMDTSILDLWLRSIPEDEFRKSWDEMTFPGSYDEVFHGKKSAQAPWRA
jgi:hypothetical protein